MWSTCSKVPACGSVSIDQFVSLLLVHTDSSDVDTSQDSSEDEPI